MKLTLMKHCMKMARCNKGGVLIFAAIALLMMVIASGLAIDISRMETAKVELYGCLDTAGLAALAKMGTKPASISLKDWVIENVRSYFLADCRTNYMQTSAVTFTFSSNPTGLNPHAGTPNNININLSPNNSVLTLDARLNEQTEFMPVVGIRTVQITGHSVVRRSTGGLELALVLDNTGSMGEAVQGGTVTARNPAKITAIKCALAGDAATRNGTCEAGNLVTFGLLDLLFSSVNTNLYVGLITFSDMVNVGATQAPGSNFISNWNAHGVSDCVDARSGSSTLEPGLSLDIADDPPNGSPFKALSNTGNDNCPAAFHPMTTSENVLINQIKRMTSRGNTMIQLGFAWGWRMLSPNWTGLWGSTPTYTAPGTTTAQLLPLPYNTKGMTKVVILMTDGDNTVPNDLKVNNAYENSSSPPTSVSRLRTLTLQACTAMKNKGIVIYTIGFGKPGTIDTSLLKSCATAGSQPHSFIAPTNAELEADFNAIGGQLTNLVVSQ